MKKKLAVFDVDETLIEWEYHNFVDCFPRTGAIELLQSLKERNIDLALFSTASIRYVLDIQRNHFSDFEFVKILGSRSVTLLNGEKVKDLSVFFDEYDLENIVLIDDKSRNARLYPNNFIEVKRPHYYRNTDRFDTELLKVKKKILNFFKA